MRMHGTKVYKIMNSVDRTEITVLSKGQEKREVTENRDRQNFFSLCLVTLKAGSDNMFDNPVIAMSEKVLHGLLN